MRIFTIGKMKSRVYMKNPQNYLSRLLLLIMFLTIIISAGDKSPLDSLRYLVNNSEGNVKIDHSLELAKKLIEYSKITQGISLAGDILQAVKKSGNIKYRLRAYSIISRGYLVSGDIRSALNYGDSTLQLARMHNDEYGLALGYQAYGPPHMYLGDTQTAIKMLDSSLVIFTEEEYPIERAVTNLLIASVFATTGQAEASFPYLEEAKRVFEKNGDKYRSATVELNIGLIRGTILGQYEEAINISLAVLPYFEEVGDSLKIATGKSTVATCYDGIGNYDRAIEYYESALSMMGSNGNIIMKANFLNNLGEVYKHKNDYANAYQYYKKALDVFEMYDISEGIIVAENNIGECLLSQNEYGDALLFFQKALKKVDTENDFYKSAILYKNLGNVYLETNNLSQAISYFHQSINAGKKIEILEEIFPAYEKLSEAYGKKGDYINAYRYHKLFSEVKEEFIKSSNAEKVSEIDTKYETVKKEKEIELLKKNQEIQELQISQQQLYVLAMILIVVLTVMFSMIVYKRYTDNKKLNLELEERNMQIEVQKDQLKRINDKLTNTNEKLTVSEADLKQLNATKDKFFSVIAHDLKGPFSSLLGLTEIMKEDFDSMTDEDLKNMSTGIYNASRKVYTLTENLLEWSRSQLDMLKIKSEVFDFNELVNENVRLYKDNLQAKRIKISKELCRESTLNTDKDMVNFTLRNLINNAIKFSRHEGEINISSSIEKNYLKVQVADTGIGIPEESLENLFKIESAVSTKGTEEEKGTGLGLILVNEFIEKIGGSINVKSRVNHGTTFTFTIPITN